MNRDVAVASFANFQDMIWTQTPLMHIKYNMSIKDGHRFSLLQQRVGDEKMEAN